MQKPSLINLGPVAYIFAVWVPVDHIKRLRVTWQLFSGGKRLEPIATSDDGGYRLLEFRVPRRSKEFNDRTISNFFSKFCQSNRLRYVAPSQVGEQFIPQAQDSHIAGILEAVQ